MSYLGSQIYLKQKEFKMKFQLSQVIWGLSVLIVVVLAIYTIYVVAGLHPDFILGTAVGMVIVSLYDKII